MFSSSDLVHLVFADETDTYYCDNLLKLSLRQYLWLKLHEKYSAVYFLTPSENALAVTTYGDLKCAAYEPSRGFWALMRAETEMGALLKWVHKQLTSKRSEPAAFVCALEDLCKASEYPGAAGALEAIAREKNRTGILVLTASVSVEKTRDLLLRSPVFDCLQENAVLDIRTGPPRDLFGAVRRGKGESCVFLNTFSRDHIYPILLHAALEQKGRSLSPGDLEAAAGYLVRYLASLEMQRDCPLFRSRTPGPYMRFQDLYEQLKDERVWNSLMDRCLRERDPEDGQAENAEHAAGFHIVWDNSPYAGKCMALQIPGGIKRIDTQAERAADILLAIQRELLRPKNRAENEMLRASAADFLNRLEGVSRDDLGTYKRVLKAVHFCVTRMYVEERSAEEAQVSKIVEFLKNYIVISGECHQAHREIDPILAGQRNVPGKLTGLTIQQARDWLAARENALGKYQDFVSASIMNLSMASCSDKIVEQMEALKQEVEKHRAGPGGAGREEAARREDLPDPVPDGGGPESGAEPYTLDVIDYRLTPPT